MKWLANDIAAVTYQTTDDSVQQFIGTYGDRGTGISYYHVAAEIYGSWQGDGIELVRDSYGMTITENGETEHFESEDIQQFGTLAVVLRRDGEAVWTVSLDESFEVETDPFELKEGTISIYQATMEDNEPITLVHQNNSVD